jgi:hypothetical protein
MQRYASLSRSTLLVVSVLAASLLLGVNARAQLINGEFTLPGLPSGVNAEGLIPAGQNSSTSLTGWTVARSDLADSNVYYYTTHPDAFDPAAFFLPNPPKGFNFAVQLDSSTGDGSQERFTQGAALSQALFLPANAYQLSFYFATENGSYNGVDKGGTSGVLVNLLGPGITSGSLVNAEYTVTNPVPATRANTVWEHVTADFTVSSGSPGTPNVVLAFQDDPNPLYGNNLGSSNISIAGVSIQPVPESNPLTLMGGVVVSLAGFQTLLKRRHA